MWHRSRTILPSPPGYVGKKRSTDQRMFFIRKAIVIPAGWGMFICFMLGIFFGIVLWTTLLHTMYDCWPWDETYIPPPIYKMISS